MAGLLAVIVVVAGVALVGWLSFGSKNTNSASSPPNKSQSNQGSASSRNHTVKQYDKGGIHFSYYSDWSVTKNEAIGKTANTRAVHIEGPDNAIVTLICLPASNPTTLDDFATSMAKDRPAETKEEFTKLGFPNVRLDDGTSEPIVGRIQGQEQSGIRQRFTIELPNAKTPHEADFYLARGGPYKVVVISQVAEEHLAQTRPDWQLIFDTLKFDEAP